MRAREGITKLMEKWDAMTLMRPQRREDFDDDFTTSSGNNCASSKFPWKFGTSYRESSYRGGGRGGFLSCIKRRGNGRGSGGVHGSTMVTLLVGKDRQAFHVEPQVLDHNVVQCLLQRARSSHEEDDDGVLARRIVPDGQSPLYEEDIRLDCDAILFDHILWLMYNDDPSLRNINLEELMEFYTLD